VTRVPRWDWTDIRLEDPQPSRRPFDVRLSAVFSGPDGVRLTVPGYYDGDRVWVVRFSPTAVGHWTWQTRSDSPGLSGLSGELEATVNDPRNHGQLRVDAERPHHFVHEDGTRNFVIGYECDWLFALDLGRGDELAATRRLLDDVAANGFNHVVMNVYAHDVGWNTQGRGTPYDYSAPGACPFGGTNDGPDHDVLNPGFFAHLDRVILLMKERGLTAHLMIYVWNKKVAWPAQRSDADDRYLDYIVARYQACTNVVWDVSKEALTYGYCDAAYITDRARRIRHADAYRHLLTVHDAAYCAAHAREIDFYSIQSWRTELYSEMRRLRETLSMPVFNIEHGGYERGPYLTFPGDYTDPIVCLDRNYQCIFAGVYSTYYWQCTAWNIVVPDRSVVPAPDRPMYEYFRWMQAFFGEVDYHRMEPLGPVSSSGYCLAYGGDGTRRAYLFYKPRGNYAIHATVARELGRVEAEWFNPLTGERLAAPAVDAQPWHELRSPWGDEMAIVRITGA
jgi:hypothetical protein